MADESKPSQTPSGPKDTKTSYFAKLDAAFAKLTTSSPAAAASAAPPLPRISPPSMPAAASPAVASAPEVHPASGLVAEAFAALLALEDGEPGAKPVRLTTQGSEPPAAPQITDAFIDEIVRRVVERLGPNAARAAVTDVVSGIAERLVKEEIDRIRDKNA
jgi:hypothetical protein